MRIISHVVAGTLAALTISATLAGTSAQAMAAGHALTCNGPPSGRVWDSLAYDPAQHDIVLIDGDSGNALSTPGTVFGKITWIWNGTRWTPLHPAPRPRLRTGAAIVYDNATHQMLLFGGSRIPSTGGGFLNGTWTWNGHAWIQLHPATSPSARHNADLVYDAADHEVIMFGGYGGSYLADTWAWNGRTWTQLHPATSPPARDTDSLVYDPATRTAILFGGFGDEGRFDDTWSWNGTNWTQLHPASTPSVVSTAWQAAYDQASRQLVIFGGDPGDPSSFSGATWTWTGSTWVQLQPATSPLPRAYGAMTYDQALHKIIMFGGSTGTTDPATLWEWNGTTWQLTPSCSTS